MKLPTNCENSVKSPKGCAPVGRLYAAIWVKFSVLGPRPHPCPDWGEIWCGGVDSVDSSTPYFILIGATCLPSGGKTSKWPPSPRVTKMPVLCAVRNAASSYANCSEAALMRRYIFTIDVNYLTEYQASECHRMSRLCEECKLI